GLDQDPGEYTVKLTVKDMAAGSSEELTRTYQILPRAFGLVGVSLSSDSEGRVAATSFRRGQRTYINLAAIGFDRDKTTRQAHVNVVLNVLDEENRPTLDKPSVGEVKQEVSERVHAIPMQFALELN